MNILCVLYSQGISLTNVIKTLVVLMCKASFSFDTKHAATVVALRWLVRASFAVGFGKNELIKT